MFFSDLVESSYSVYKERRESLVKEVIKENNVKNGLILFFGDFEKGESISFELNDEGSKSIILIPNMVEDRKKWFGDAIEANEKDAAIFYIDKIDFLGDKLSGATFDRYFDKQVYENILNIISVAVKNGAKIFAQKNNVRSSDQRFILDRIGQFLPEISSLEGNIIDIYGIVSKMRRKKDLFEIGKISEAINLTAVAHESGARIISEDGTECEVQAAVEFVFTAAGAKRAYCTIVACGRNAIALHYNDNSDDLSAGDLVVIDAGAKVDGYCADITRTYPVSGSFTKRQEELYNIVLEAQKYIASIAKPGYYLKNYDYPEKCLTSLTKEFFKKYGLEKYFIHGIGHFLGLDVHDIGGLKSPIQEGDVITIEPGLYIPEESIGIRIEDNYWITGNKAICLSDMIPKEPAEICEFMKNGLSQDQE